MIFPYTLLRFSIDLAPGDVLRVWGDAFGDYLHFHSISIYAPSESYVGGLSGMGSIGQSFDRTTGKLGERGTYSIQIENLTDTGIFTLEIGCTLRNGTVISPGDVIEPQGNNQGVNIPQPAITPFSGFGFPGVTSRDFSSGIEIPLPLGQTQTSPLASDVALYTYKASAGETASLSISRGSGDISIGVAVVKMDTNEIIFLGGMPYSNNLSVELTFPSSGTYAIGLFRLDTAEHSGTSGAVQIKLE